MLFDKDRRQLKARFDEYSMRLARHAMTSNLPLITVSDDGVMSEGIKTYEDKTAGKLDLTDRNVRETLGIENDDDMKSLSDMLRSSFRLKLQNLYPATTHLLICCQKFGKITYFTFIELKGAVMYAKLYVDSNCQKKYYTHPIMGQFRAIMRTGFFTMADTPFFFNKRKILTELAEAKEIVKSEINKGYNPNPGEVIFYNKENAEVRILLEEIEEHRKYLKSAKPNPSEDSPKAPAKGKKK